METFVVAVAVVASWAVAALAWWRWRRRVLALLERIAGAVRPPPDDVE